MRTCNDTSARPLYIGIDLGTTNSVAAVFDGETLTTVRNAEGGVLTPSVVRIDQGNARQRAEILIDGENAGDWYLVEGNASSRWSERDFFLPQRFTHGKSRLKLGVRPDPESPPGTRSAPGELAPRAAGSS